MKKEMLDALKDPFPVEKIRWRRQFDKKLTANNKDYALAYVDARDVMNRLDEVVGPGNWQRKHKVEDGVYICHVAIWDETKKAWVWKGDGAGETNFEAQKGGTSDSFKRACVNWGIARYLYDLKRAVVRLDKFGNIMKEDIPPFPPEAIPMEERKDVLIHGLRVLFKQAKDTERLKILFQNAQAFHQINTEDPLPIEKVGELNLEELEKVVNYIHKELELM